MTSLSPGSIFDSNYEIVENLGSGGMGSVYRARQLGIDRIIAIKVMHPRYCRDINALKRFQREAKTISILAHPNIVSVYSLGCSEETFYLVMELVDGESLSQILEKRGRLLPQDALPLLLQICDAMIHAHKQQVLHRDLKPDNVMIVNKDAAIAKVVDFGLSRLLGHERSDRLTRTGEVVGDVRYMSPEQCHGEDLDARSDIYSFGCLMYELLTGAAPFMADDPVAIMRQHISNEPEPFSRKLELPHSIEAIVFTAMAKSPSDRFESFEAVAEALRDFQKSPDKAIPSPQWSGARGKVLSGKILTAIVLVVVAVLAGTSVFMVQADAGKILFAKLRYSFAANEEDKICYAIEIASSLESRQEFTESEYFYREARKLGVAANQPSVTLRCDDSLARILIQANKIDEAANLLEESLKQGQKTLRSGQSAEAIFDPLKALLNTYSRLNPQRAQIQAHEIAETYFSKNMAARASDLLSSLATPETDRINVLNLIMLGTLSLTRQNEQEAQKYFDRAIQAVPAGRGRLDCLQMISELAVSSGAHALAISYLEDELALEDKRGGRIRKIHEAIADCYFNLKNYKLAAKHYAAVISSIKSDSSAPKSTADLAKALDLRAQCDLLTGQYADAARGFGEELQVLESLSPPPEKYIAGASAYAGLALKGQGKLNDASLAFDRAEMVIQKSEKPQEMRDLQQIIQQGRKEIAARSARAARQK